MPYLANLQEIFGHWIVPFGTGWFLGLGSIIFLALIVWSIYWKGKALWKAARSSDKAWFIALLIVNTVGILEILYIYVFSKKTEQAENQK